MAERRMFAKTIIDSDAFLDMPASTQSLYFHLSMRADDDGFVNNPKKINRVVGGSDDDLKLLIAKNFIIPFDSGIVVIKHWKIHNYIRGDRKKETVYTEEMALLAEKENGSYILLSNQPFLLEETKTETKRQKAYKESSLPYSFEYKIKAAFYGEICPVCGYKMCGSVDECGIGTDIRKPSIQHNKPISKGGKHELGNISVICHNCNVSLKDTETGASNAEEVIKKWDEICGAGECQSNVSQMSGVCHTQVRLGKVRLGKVRLEKDTLSGRPDDMKEIITHLNAKTESSYRSTSKATSRLINARMNEGFTVEDFKKVIDVKCEEWLSTEMAKYLRPQTLFGTKFESYLNQWKESDDYSEYR